MKRIVQTVFLMLISFLLLAGCEMAKIELEDAQQPGINNQPGSRDFDIKNVNNGFFYQEWHNRDWEENNHQITPHLDYVNHAAGRYTVDWQGNESDWNFVCGKGWNSGPNFPTSPVGASGDKVINYSGSFNPDPSGSDYQNCLLTFYGWANNYDIEYYVLESYGEYDPSKSSEYTHAGNYTSDGNNYEVYWTVKTGQPSPDNGDRFLQIYSIRTPRLAPGTISGTITLSNHIAKWNEYAGVNQNDDLVPITSHNFQVMATEGYGAVGGSSDITVSLGSGGGSEGFFTLDGKYVSGGQHYLGLGEMRYPVSGTGSGLSGLFTGILFHEQSGNTMEIELYLMPLDNATATEVSTFKNPPPNTFSHLSGSSAAGERASRRAYSATDRAVSAYRGWVNVSADGLTINVPSFNFRGIQVNNFTMTYEHISDDPDPGVPYSVIRYTYSYNPGGATMETKALIFMGENPRDIPATLPLRRILEDNMSPAAVVSGDSYSFSSVWSGRHVTVTDNGNNAAVKAQPVNEGWTSQDWVTEAVDGKDRVVRIKNIWTGKYLHAQSNEENAKAVCYDLHTDWTSQQWAYEQTGYREVRLRNLWTNKYLTVVDTGDYSDIILKELNTGWTSQEWNVDWLKFKY